MTSVRPGGPRPHNPIGIHGYRHTLPKDLVSELRGEEITVEVRLFGDRAGKQKYRRVRTVVQW